MILRIISLIIFIMFFSSNIARFARGHFISLGNIFIMSASGVGFIYSMGWLS